MTLKVKIYERVFDVTYPSEKRVQDLMLEFATQCKGAIKPGAKRRFFVCIHCGKADFSNKMRLNQHRFRIGCENAKFPDGVPALLLPCPDFESGQGKKVEVMRKGVSDQGAKKRKAKVEDSFHVDTSGTEDAVDLDASQPSKQSNSSVTADSYIDSPQVIVPTPLDLLFGEAPTNVEKELSQGFRTEFSKVQVPVLQVYKKRQGRTSGLEVEKRKTKTKGVCIQEKPMDLQSPSLRLMEPICKVPVSRHLRSRLKLKREAKLPVSDTLNKVSKAIDDVLLEVRFI